MSNDIINRLQGAKSEVEKTWILTEAFLEALPPELAEATLAAAIPHWFGAKILAALLEIDITEADKFYQEIKKLPFSESFGGLGFTLHSLTRSAILFHFATTQLEKYKTYIQRAYQYFCETEDARSIIEAIYHLSATDSERGLKQFKSKMRYYLKEKNYAAANNLLRNMSEISELGLLDNFEADKVKRQKNLMEIEFYDMFNILLKALPSIIIIYNIDGEIETDSIILCLVYTQKRSLAAYEYKDYQLSILEMSSLKKPLIPAEWYLVIARPSLSNHQKILIESETYDQRPNTAAFALMFSVIFTYIVGVDSNSVSDWWDPVTLAGIITAISFILNSVFPSQSVEDAGFRNRLKSFYQAILEFFLPTTEEVQDEEALAASLISSPSAESQGEDWKSMSYPLAPTFSPTSGGVGAEQLPPAVTSKFRRVQSVIGWIGRRARQLAASPLMRDLSVAAIYPILGHTSSLSMKWAIQHGKVILSKKSLRSDPMSSLKQSDIQKVVDLLTPFMESEAQRRAWLILALGPNASLLGHVNFAGPVEPFLVNMIKALVDYGEIAPGKQALWALLEVVRERVGVDRQAKIDSLHPALSQKDDQGGHEHRHGAPTRPAIEPPKRRDNKPVIRYFVSYAHDDNDLKDKLLKPLKQRLAIAKDYCFEAWDDGEILPGEHWHEQIQAAVAGCQFGLLLVSPAFLGSQYIQDHELQAFIATNSAEQGPLKRAIPVALKPIPFDKSIDLKGLEQLQVFRDSNRKAFQECSNSISRDKFASELFQQIFKIVKRYGSHPRLTESEPYGRTS
ncbi:MAG: TIR domain-containing protein [Candidatus Competibacteraceae bacterium]